jgi:glucose/arabinose dehydrogenase
VRLRRIIADGVRSLSQTGDRLHTHPLRRAAITLALLLAAVPVAASPSLPANFWFFNAVPGTQFDTPTTIAFLPDGRLLVGEKRGRVWMVKDGFRLPTPVWSSENEILNEGDKGLLAITVDPDFTTNRRVYFLYTVDPDTNGVDESNSDGFGRLARFQLRATGDTNTVDPATRTLLFGRVWSEGPTVGSLTHTIGSLRWGADKSLIVSCGEGSQFTYMDAGGHDPEMFEPGRANPNEDIGAFRSQDITSMCGKVLRINPQDGHGYPSNPFWNGDPTSVRSRVWAYGLRNPFRLTVRPGGNPDPALGHPGSIFIGDVGWETWEELDVSKSGGENFGWPCREGTHDNPEYDVAQPAHNGCGSTGTSTNPSPYTGPLGDWHHDDPSISSIPWVEGNSALGGAFYTGVGFPVTWRGRLFFGDYGYGWIRTATVDPGDNVTAWNDFAFEMEGPVDFAVGPFDGDLYYVSILTGEVRRIHYFPLQPGNQPPQAVADFGPTTAAAPYTVVCSSVGSSDPDGDSLRTTWNFGDGTGSFLPKPTHTFTQPGIYLMKLTVDDNHLADNTVTQLVTITGGVNTPPVAIMVSPTDSSFAVAGDTLHLVASAIDGEQPDYTLSYDWDIALHHNNHIHPNTFVANTPIASYRVEQHDDGTGVWYEIRLRVTDAGGLADTLVAHVFPEVDLELLDLSTAPDTVVAGAANTFRFTVRNGGHMPAPFSRWRMTVDGALFAEGDTLVDEGDTLRVAFDRPVTLPVGVHTLRVAVDTLGAVVETNETNNALTRPLVVKPMPVTGVDPTPAMLALSRGVPNPAPGTVHFALDLPARAQVEMRVLDVQGREVWAEPVHVFTPGRWSLAWDGRTHHEGTAAAGIYLVQVRVDGRTFVRRVARMR